MLVISQSFLACDEEFCDTELTIPEVDQLVSWDEGEKLIISMVVIVGHIHIRPIEICNN